jgi:multiple sugar transport system permease protein
LLKDTVVDFAAMSHPWPQRVARLFDRHLSIVLVAPAVLLLAALIAYPLAFNAYISLHDVSLLNIRRGGWPAVGLHNYLLAVQERDNIQAFIRTLLFLVGTVGPELVLGMAGALAFNTSFAGKGFLMTLALVPMMVTPVAVGLVWRMLLNAQWGIINYYLRVVGLPPQVWLGTPVVAFLSVTMVEIWWGVSFVILVLLGGLSALPSEPFEAAAIDGASSWQAFRYVTLPLMSRLILVLATIRSIDAFRAFDMIYVLTQGGPADATRVFALQVYTTGFERAQFGLAAAQAMLLFVVVMGLSGGLIRGLASSDQRE